MKEISWVKSSLKDLKKLPIDAQGKLMGSLDYARQGLTSTNAFSMKGDLREVTEIRVNDKAGTYRCMYTANIGSKIYVLHAFQKKSTQGIETSQRDLALIRQRLKIAKEWAKAESS